MVKAVEEAEWKIAQALLNNREDLSRLEIGQVPEIKHKFIKIDKEIFAFTKCLGKGGYGEAWLICDRYNKQYVTKETFAEDDYVSLDFPNNLFKFLGFIKGVDELNEYELETLEDLGRLKASIRFQRPGHSLMVMEYLGRPLDSYFATHTLAFDEQLVMAKKVIESVNDFHLGRASREGICRIHNDIKGDNFLLNVETGQISLIDFGEAFTINRLQAINATPVKHPRATSFEPYIVAPEIQHQLGIWWLPWSEFAHAHRQYTTNTDLYLTANVISSFSKDNIILKALTHAMFQPVVDDRPTGSLLLALLAVCIDSNKCNNTSSESLAYLANSPYENFSTINLKVLMLILVTNHTLSSALSFVDILYQDSAFSETLNPYFEAIFEILCRPMSTTMANEAKSFIRYCIAGVMKEPSSLESHLAEYLSAKSNHSYQGAINHLFFCHISERQEFVDTLLTEMRSVQYSCAL